ncbi:MAG: MarR family transcriptional regulator [Pseudomonadota bacterium]
MSSSKFTSPPPLSEHVCYSIYSMNLAIQRAYKPALDSLGLTYPQYLVMNLLWDRDGQPVGSLAEQLDLEPSTLTPMLKRLESSGLVERTRNPKDERQVLIGLTAQGRKLRSSSGCVAQTMLDKSGMDMSELKALNEQISILLSRLKDGAESDSAVGN